VFTGFARILVTANRCDVHARPWEMRGWFAGLLRAPSAGARTPHLRAARCLALVGDRTPVTSREACDR